MISCIVSTIGCSFLLDSLDSMRQPFSEIIVVLDKVGRSCADPAVLPSLSLLEESLARRHVKLVYYDAVPGTWAVQNGCYNVGARHAKYDWILFTHDDVTWQDFDYELYLASSAHLHELGSYMWRGTTWRGKRVPGIILPEYEAANQVLVPTFPEGTRALTQAVSPVSQIIHRQAYEAIGGFDEEYGIWYDGQLEHETVLRDWWWLHVPTPVLRHESNRTYRTNNWGNRWTPNPKWGHHAENFERKYGVKPTMRKLGLDSALIL